MYRQSEELVKQQYVLHMSPQYGELRPTSGWDLLISLGYSCKFQLVSRLGSVTARHLVVSQTLRRWTESATYIREGDHHVGHWLTFLVYTYLCRPLEMILSEIVSYRSGTYDLLQHTQDNTGPHTRTVWSHVRSLNFVTIWFATLKLRQLSMFGDLAFGGFVVFDSVIEN